MVGRVGPNDLEVHEVHRFPNEPVGVVDGLHWDVLRLFREVVAGLREAGRVGGALASVGVDSWGVDYGLLDESGGLLGDPYHYRDGRTEGSVGVVHGAIPHERLYERTGIQFLPINTVYQLAAARAAGQLDAARTLLMIPDLFGYWLTGNADAGVEETNASTTGLYDVTGRSWARDLIDLLGFPGRIFPSLRSPGSIIGPLHDSVLTETGLGPHTVLTLVGSHDTASAVAAIPVEDDRFAYIASGTWSLAGVELDGPVLTDASRAANFTNEGGVDGRIRYLRNVMGLWLLQESMRKWRRNGRRALTGLIDAAAELPAGGPVIDPDDAAFLPPGDMPARIAEACRATDQRPPATRPEVVRCILDSLAAAYARALRDAMRLTGRKVKVVHVVGGGSQNTLLCQLTADAAGLPVVAGPVEATALGNVLVQARAHGMVDGDIDDLRALVRRTQDVRRYEPRAALVGSGV